LSGRAEWNLSLCSFKPLGLNNSATGKILFPDLFCGSIPPHSIKEKTQDKPGFFTWSGIVDDVRTYFIKNKGFFIPRLSLEGAEIS
jgi:hypothetical protein